MIIEAVRISSYALDFIKKYRSGKIHSVYRKTINIDFDGQLIALQELNSILSPISIILPLSGPARLGGSVSPGDKVSIIHNEIIFRDTRIKITDKTEIFDTRFNFSGTKKNLKAKAREMIYNAKKTGFSEIFSDPSDVYDPVIIAAKTRISNAKDAIKNHEFKRACEFLCSLIGLGAGLTPSGDDFLCGVLAGLPEGEFRKQLSEMINSKLNYTNDISRAFLTCAINGEQSEAVKKFFADPSAGAEQECMRDFLAIGHSSGIDTLCGIYFALEI